MFCICVLIIAAAAVYMVEAYIHTYYAIASSGSDTIVDTAAVENFQRFQANVPLVSFTTQQMVQSADKGIVDGVVMEYQSYQNDPTLQRNYEYQLNFTGAIFVKEVT